MPVVNVQRGVVDAARVASTTVAPPVNFGDIDSTFERLTNNRRMSAGRADASATNLDADDLSAGVQLVSASQIDIGRQTTGDTSNMRIAWETVEYIGPQGDPSEFIVRGRYKLTLSGETTTQAVPGVMDDDDVIPFITGILCTSTADDASQATAIAWMDSGTLNIKRGGGSNDTVYVWITVVEFVGSDWSVKHGRVMSAADTGTITLVDNADGVTAGGGDIVDWDTAVIYHQFCKNNLNGVDDSIADTCCTYFPNASTTIVDWAFHDNHVDSAGAGGNDEHFMHVLRHPNLAVTRYLNTANVAPTNNIDISSAGLTDLAQSSVEVSRSSSGNGTAYARGWVNARLTSLTNLELWIHRSGNTLSTRMQVIDWSGIQAAAGPGYAIEIWDDTSWVTAEALIHDGSSLVSAEGLIQLV